MPISQEELTYALEDLLESASQEGTSEDLTVVSKGACDKLQEILDRVNDGEAIEV